MDVKKIVIVMIELAGKALMIQRGTSGGLIIRTR